MISLPTMVTCATICVTCALSNVNSQESLQSINKTNCGQLHISDYFHNI